MKIKFKQGFLSCKRGILITTIMRVFIFLCCSVAFAMGTSKGVAQNADVVINTNKTLSIKQVFQLINKQTDYKFIYRHDLIKSAPDIHLEKGVIKAYELLDKCLTPINFTYEFTDKGTIVVMEKQITNSLQSIEALQFQVSGKVTDMDGEMLPGANIVEKGTANGVTVDFDGNFVIDVADENAILVVSYIGFATKEVAVNGQINITITLAESASALDEIVVVGYGTVKRSDLTGAVSSIKQDKIEKVASGNVGSAIQGQMAGVQVTSNSGKPGEGVDVKIRGTSSLGSNDPLYIIDGIPSNINNISPNDVESIEVLKDGASAAIYGSRAANGVVLITTKRAREGKFRLDVNGYYGLGSIGKNISVMNAEQHVRTMNQAYINDGLQPFYENSPESYGVGTNWSEEFYSVAPMANLNLNYSGGSKNAKVNSSIDYFNQDGIALNTGFERLSARINSEFTKGKFTFNENLSAYLSQTNNESQSSVKRTLEMPTTVPVYNENNLGGYGGTYGDMFDIFSPIAAQNLFTNNTKNDFIRANFTVNYEAIEKLNIKLNTGGTLNNGYNFNHAQRYDVGTLKSPLNSISENRSRNISWIVEGTADYEWKIEKQTFNFLLGVSSQKESYRNTSGSGSGLPDGIFVLGASTQDMSVSGTEWNHTLASQFGRIHYNYDERYLLSATVRRDGSSRFAEKNKWAVFPSLAMAWRISNESFFSESSVINDFKLRASYGELGNQEIGNYAYSALINSSQHYPFGMDQSLDFGATQLNLASPNLKWESNISKDIGLDISMLRNTLSVTADYYESNSNDLLLRVPIPMSNGSAQFPYQNIGKIRNRGFEFAVNWNKEIGDLRMNLSTNLTTVNNKVIKLGTGDQIIMAGSPYHLAENTTLTKQGGEVGEFFLIKTDGVFQSQEEINNYTHIDESGITSLIQPNAVPGDIRFKDANNDGSITSGDRVYAGSAMPDFTYGFNFQLDWRKFDLYGFFNGSHGNKIFNGTAYAIEGLPNFTNMGTKLLDAWTPDNLSNVPRVSRLDPNGNNRSSSDRFLEDGSYLRLKELQLGYTVSTNKNDDTNTGIDHLRIYVSAQNLFTITNYSGYNPDIYSSSGLLNRGVDTGIYPYSKTFMLGVQISL
ncbi:TonB-dependent receptor P3 [Arenibacter antarcticus]|uniref:SusC/RagA family TonB-linked outer membrane protein n=1 Tax=Arenibacter antarcticus TaxID=2040469 RepID=A0ABW5VEW8_9FLAO|nr:TonB-dependent receptor [Arenibacter sp. H213]MCM4167401.1 SusC/RagA family TonB-linked outer membrane protein [Arenibacter sp. H213]